MGRIITALVIHHGTNRAYYAWYSKHSRDLVIDERFCPPHHDILARWIEVEVDERNRACGPVNLIRDRYSIKQRGSIAEVNVEIESAHSNDGSKIFFHHYFGNVTDPDHLIPHMDNSNTYDVWIISKESSDGTKWIVARYNGPGQSLQKNQSQQPNHNDYFDRSGPDGRNYETRRRSPTPERGRRYDQNVDGDYRPDYRINSNQVPQYQPDRYRSRSPEFRNQFQDNHDNNTRRGDDRFPINQDNYVNSERTSQYGAGNDRYYRNSSPLRARPREDYGIETQRRRSRTPDRPNTANISSGGEYLRSSNGPQAAFASHGSGASRSRQPVSSRASPPLLLPDQPRARSPVTSESSLSRAETTDSEDDKNVANDKYKPNLPVRSSPISADLVVRSEDRRIEQGSSLTKTAVSNRIESKSVTKTPLTPKQMEIKRQKSKLIQMKRLFEFFIKDEGIAKKMQIRGVEEYEELERLLRSI